MYKLKEMILMLCFILSGALCYANGEARIEKEQGEGIPIEIIESGSCTGPSRGNSIIPTLNGHVLTVELLLMVFIHVHLFVASISAQTN